MTFRVPNEHRVRTGNMASSDADGNNGFFLMFTPRKKQVAIIASDGMGWEHVSVSMPNETPSWDDMAYIKSRFWDANDCVMQLHPPKKNYVNCHRHCLHLWKPIGVEIPQPPKMLVGPT